MLVRFALLLRGLDMRSADDRARIPERLHDLVFEASEELTYVVVICDELEASRFATEIARRIERHLEGVSVVAVHDELVSLSDIADRVDAAHEAVRLWAAGRRRADGRAFPLPRQVVSTGRGSRSTKLYAWREVVSWVREVLRLDPEDGIGFLADREIAEVNACMARLMPVQGEVVLRHHAASAPTATAVPTLRFEEFMAITSSPFGTKVRKVVQTSAVL